MQENELHKAFVKRRQPSNIANFAWAIENKLAGMRMPANPDELLELIKTFEINMIITLTEQPLDYPLPDNIPCTRIHIPITDFGVPSISQANEFVSIVKDALSIGKRVAVHCHAGAGRTGTMLGCYLVGVEQIAADKVIDSLRKQGRVLSNRKQEDFVRNYVCS